MANGLPPTANSQNTDHIDCTEKTQISKSDHSTMREWHADWLIRVVSVSSASSVFWRLTLQFAVAAIDPAYRATFTSTGATPVPVYMATVSRPRSNATRSA